MKKRGKIRMGAYTIELTNPDKALFPDDDITKSDLIDYYRRIAMTMLPYMRERPVVMHRFIQGIKGEGFYQREAGDYFPHWIRRTVMKKQDGSTSYVVCNNAATLVYLAEQDCITPHVWLSRIDRPDNPDLMIFDLDPSHDSFEPVRHAAYSLRVLLSELGLAVFVKTTGSRGLHVEVPLDRKAGFDYVRIFSADVAGLLAKREPEHLTAEQRKDKRHGRVYIDTMRNSYAQIAVAPYATRALPGAPVATPIDWQELKDPHLHAQSYNIKNIFIRLEHKENPWQGMWQHARSLNEPRQKLDTLLSG